MQRRPFDLLTVVALAVVSGLLLLACGREPDPGPTRPPPGVIPPDPAREEACDDAEDNDADGFTDCDDLDCRAASDRCELAPPLDRSVPTTLARAARFLYTGKDPIQKEADPKAFVPHRIAIVRGHTVGADGAPMGFVRVTVLGHPEYGYSTSRADGAFDLAVNGGGRLVLDFQKAGYVRTQRAAMTGWNRYSVTDPVALVAQASTATPAQPGAPRLQIARADPVTDGRGTRQPTVLIPPNTRATAVLPDGSQQPLGELHVRITELCTSPGFRAVNSEGRANPPAAGVGPSPTAVGPLGTASALEHTVEYSIDEADALEAVRVDFSTPVISYVENYLRLPAGTELPTRYYDRSAGQWQHLDAGRIVQIASENGGLVSIDLDGDGEDDSEADLRRFGITEAEREALADLYEPGTTLLRRILPHFSPFQSAMAVTPPIGAAPFSPPAHITERLDEPSVKGDILVEPQASQQDVGLTGTPLSLHYQSNRTPSAVSDFTLELPIIGSTVPEGLLGAAVQVVIAGRVHPFLFPAAPNQTLHFTWDGRDAFGRLVQGEEIAQVTVTFAFPGTLPGLDPGAFSADGLPRAPVVRTFEVPLGSFDARAYGLGGFSLNQLHAFDPAKGIVYFGYGDTRHPGNGAFVVGQPLEPGLIEDPDSVAVAPDGSVLITDDAGHAILRVHPDGSHETIAGAGAAGAAGSIVLGSPQGLFQREDGTVLVADFELDQLLSIQPDGSSAILVGDTPEALIREPLVDLDGIAEGPDGALYIASDDVVLRFSAGTMETYAGGGNDDVSNELPATAARLRSPSGLALAPDGTLFFSERHGHRIRACSPDGTLRTIAGTGVAGFDGDRGPALSAQLDNPRGLALAPDGTIFFADEENHRVRSISPTGVITTVAGGGESEFEPALGATALTLEFPDGVALSPDGTLFVASKGGFFSLTAGTPAGALEEAVVPSPDGSAIYRFDREGRHLETLDALTGVSLLRFDYDDAGHIIRATDLDGLVTEFQRDTAGTLTRVRAPFGQQTEIGIDAGRVVRVTDPTDHDAQFIYKDDTFLIEHAVDPTGQSRHYEYGDLGRLSVVTDPTGYVETLTGTQTEDGSVVCIQTGAGRTLEHGVRFLGAGQREHLRRGSDGLAFVTEDDRDLRAAVLPDGSEWLLFKTADPRWGGQVPNIAETRLTTPSGRELSVSHFTTVHLDDPGDPLSLRSEETLTEIGGRIFESHYDVASRTRVMTSALGRRSTVVYDEKGRPVRWESPGQPVVERRYDGQGRLAEVIVTGDTDQRITTFGYGNDGLLQSTTNAEGESVSVRRDAVGRPTGLIRADASEVSWSFDPAGRLESITPAGKNPHRFNYNETDKLLELYAPPTVPTGGGFTEYEYTDGGDRDLSTIDLGDKRTVHFTYDAAGRVKALSLQREGEEEASIESAFDPATGDLARITRGNSTLAFETDGPLTTAITTTGPVASVVHFAYDESFRLASVTEGNFEATYAYDDDDLLTRADALTIHRAEASGQVDATELGALFDAQSFDGFAEIDGHVTFHDDATVFEQFFTRDALGRITEIDETIGGVQRIQRFGYDALGRLVHVEDGPSVTEYTYDANGNRLSESRDGVLAEGTYDAQDRIQSYGALEFTQTASGDLARKTDGERAVTLEYDALGNLLSVERQGFDAGPARIAYQVDGLGRRIERRVDGEVASRFVYAGGPAPIAERHADGSVTRFIYGLSAHVPDYLVLNNSKFLLVRDHVDSVRLVVDADTGEIAQRLDYDAFGRVLLDTNPGFQPFGFAGGLYDADTGLIRFGARDYDPEIGRWTAKDPILFGGGQGNLYVYAGNDPVSFVDPTGTESISERFRKWLIYGDYWGSWVFQTAEGDRFLAKIQNGALVVSSAATGVVLSEVAIAAVIARGAGAPVAAAIANSVSAARVTAGAGAAGGIATRYGPALQSTSTAAIEARAAAQQGAILYRGGVLGRSAGPEAQFWSLENPLSPGYAAKYGIPAENVAFDFVETAILRPGARFITREAPGLGANGGGAIEVVVEPGGVAMRGFFTH